MNDTSNPGNVTSPNEAQPRNDGLFPFEHTHLERLRLAAGVILELGDAIGSPLETELTIFKERVEHALLRQPLRPAGDTGSGYSLTGGPDA